MTTTDNDNLSNPSNISSSTDDTDTTKPTNPQEHTQEHTQEFPLDDLDCLNYASIEYPNEEQLKIELQIISTIIGCKLKEVRLSARFTEGEMAIMLGVSTGRIVQYESGEVGITLAELFKICHELGADVGYFMMNG